jgi:gluconolactonase
MWQQTETYPDPAVEVLDPRFLKYRITDAAVERLALGRLLRKRPSEAVLLYTRTCISR